jgi:Asp-tRNA(Asn)/Glu-tRNA(Gln) amidotransferase A subunit family amidase
MQNEDLCYLPATELAAAIRTRRLSPVELTTAILDRIAQLNPKINAYCTVVAEAALAAARQAEAATMQGQPLGPLHGIPLSFKDLTVTAGIRTTFGSKIFAHQYLQRMPWWSSAYAARGLSCSAKPTRPSSGVKASPIIASSATPATLGISTGSRAAQAAGRLQLLRLAWARWLKGATHHSGGL